jgi:uncharacterized secreted protein with C-terminal beta-propeller domain
VSGSQHGGSVAIAADRKTVLYAPPPDFVGRDTFTYQIDGGPEATVTVTVIRRVRDDRFHVEAGSRTNVLPVLANDLFGANYAGTGEVSSVTPTRAGGIATIADDHRAIVYTPPPGFHGRDTFTYTVDGRLKAEVAVTVGGGIADILPRFVSETDFIEWATQRAERYGYQFGREWSSYQYTYTGIGGAGGFEYDLRGNYKDGDYDSYVGAVTTADAFQTTLSLSDAGANRVHSETNVQIAGVDEADIVENDGDFLYVVSRGELLIVRAWPADALSLVSRLTLGGSPVGAYLHGERLTIVSRTWGDNTTPPQKDAASNYAAAWAGPWGWRGPARTLVTVLDVSDRAAPKVLRRTSVEGDYVESRRIGDYVYLVLGSDVSAPYPTYSCETEPLPTQDEAGNPIGRNDYYYGYIASAITRCKYETRDEYIERIAADLTVALPDYTTRDAEGELVARGVAVPPDAIFRPDGSNQSRLVSVVSINMSSDEPGLAASSAVMATSASKVFGSLENLYVFDQGYNDEDGATTEILQFGWDATTGGVELRASGSVAGTMLNQFSADEHNGYLRIATTITNYGSGNWSGRSENALFVLKSDAGVLEFVGSLQNLGVSESIRSVRFLGERAFITTFRDVDPLFALDLSDPAAPRTAGHVTLPGYNSYMQFIDDYHILAVGRNAAAGTVGTTQLALFDVTDLARPRLIDRDVLPRYTESIAETDHHAFGWFAHHQMLGLPTSRTVTRRVDRNGDGYRESWETVREDELFLYRIDATAAAPSELGIQQVGDLQHDSAVLRAAFIDQVLYSIAERSITAMPADDPTERIAEISLPADEPTLRTPGELLPVASIDQVLAQAHVVFGVVRDRRPAPSETPSQPQEPPVEPAPPVGPRVIDVRTVTRKRRVTAIEVQFDKDLDPAAAVDPARYEARVPRAARRNATPSSIVLPLRFAAYDEASRTVTLALARPVRIGRDITVVVKDTMTDRAGHPLADDGDGLPNTQVTLR